MADAVIVHRLGKRFRRYHPERPSTFQEVFLRGLRSLWPKEVFWALRDVNFSVPTSRMVGVIGANGSGKSTLLRLIAGIGYPDEGSIKIRGRSAALLELGAGFHRDLTGRENIFISGVLAGFTRQEVARRFDSIVAFSELESFIDDPLRTYSTGMQMRLAFAVAIHAEPEILLIDEVLSVGDRSFERKCLERIARYRAEGYTIILVSHDLTMVRELCDEVIWLRDGQLAAQGSPDLVVDQYIADVDTHNLRLAHGEITVINPVRVGEETRRRTPDMWPSVGTGMGTELHINQNRFGSLDLEITSVRLLDYESMQLSSFNGCDPLHIEISYIAKQPIQSPIFQVFIANEEGLVGCDLNTASSGLILPAIEGHGKLILQIKEMNAKEGLYYVDVGAYERNWRYAYDYHAKAYPLRVQSGKVSETIHYPPHQWEIKTMQTAQDVNVYLSSRESTYSD